MAHDMIAQKPVDDATILATKRPDPSLLIQYGLTSMLALVAAPIVFVPLYFKYHTLRYTLDEEGVSASWGILFRREVHLTYKRIQDIHVKRNFVERLLGIGTVEVQTASGSASSELAFEGMREFDALREFLYRRMRGHETAPGAASAPGGTTGGAGASAAGGASGQLGAREAEVVALLREIQAELEATRRALEAKT
jgi:membrane protein YdbS with pleckstrin-like domain